MDSTTQQQLLDWVYHGCEERNLEYKPSLNWKDEDTKNKITKTTLAMANIRDGGVIVLGVEGSGSKPTGMRPEDMHSFVTDHVLAHVNEYADPFVELSVTHVQANGKEFVVVLIREFAEVPIICKREDRLQKNFRKGAVYTRPTRMPESAEVRSQTEMREILELATIKGVRRFLTNIQRVGITEIKFDVGEMSRDRQAFDDQIEGL